MKKIILIKTILISAFLLTSCNKIGTEQLVENTITLTSVKKLDVSELLKARPIAKSVHEPQIVSFEEFTILKEFDGIVYEGSARMITYEPTLPNVTVHDILEPDGFGIDYTLHMKEVAPNRFVAKYYYEGEIFMEALLDGDMFVIVEVYSTSRWFGRYVDKFGDCVDRFFMRVISSPTLSATMVVGMYLGYSAHIAAGLTVGCLIDAAIRM